MISFSIDPVYLQVGLPALGLGLVLGLLLMWVISRKKSKKLEDELEQAEFRLKNQEALEEERKAAFELANARLVDAFSDISNRSLRANSDTFLQLAKQNLETHQEKAKRELSEREKAVESLVKPLRDALEASQRQISELEKARSEAYGGIKNQLEAGAGNAESRQGVATTRSTRSVGRNHITPPRGTGRDGGTLRLHRTGAHDNGRTGHSSGHDREDA
jgi:DNA recombination protein RmuC